MKPFHYRQRGLFGVVAGALALSVAVAAPASAAQGSGSGSLASSPGAPGIGDPYYPDDGNGGYDVKHYGLNLSYEPATDVIGGTAVITAVATQKLSSFNLDLDGLTVSAVTVNGRRATWTRADGELTVTPAAGLRDRVPFITTVSYSGVPETINDELGLSGVFHTDDGAMIVGQPHVAATWFPVNDHPLDKAAYTFRISVPAGLEAVANGRLVSHHAIGGRETWLWNAIEPMASYLATVDVGEFDLTQYREDGIRYVDAVDPDLFTPTAMPRTGTAYAWSQASNSSYKRLSRTIAVAESGPPLTFWLTLDTELEWDFFTVEARPVGTEQWTTLPDGNGHTTALTGNGCPGWLTLHPFLSHYQADSGDGSCAPSGDSGQWLAATGASDGWEQWSVDLSAYAGTDVEVALSYVSDESVQADGVFVDDVVVPGGAGSTSFEADGDALDGWVVSGAPDGSPGNENDWIATSDGPATLGERVTASLDREPEIIAFLSNAIGRYPFSDAGGIVDDLDGLSFALENQTRPVYSKDFFGDSISGDSVVVHELTHQWFGDDLALARWQDIWLNEGFATYAEWLWSDKEGLGTTQEIFDFYASLPADHPLWSLEIGDPGPGSLFDGAVYNRGAMTLHALRIEVGDATFTNIIRSWASSNARGNVSTDEFISLAEDRAGRQLDAFFDEWLFTASKPAPLSDVGARQAAPTARVVPPIVKVTDQRMNQRLFG